MREPTSEPAGDLENACAGETFFAGCERCLAIKLELKWLCIGSGR